MQDTFFLTTSILDTSILRARHTATNPITSRVTHSHHGWLTSCAIVRRQERQADAHRCGSRLSNFHSRLWHRTLDVAG